MAPDEYREHFLTYGRMAALSDYDYDKLQELACREQSNAFYEEPDKGGWQIRVRIGSPIDKMLTILTKDRVA